ncbi:MAG TPA: hypothetical protein VIF37_10870 [Methylobacter sp.]
MSTNNSKTQLKLSFLIPLFAFFTGAVVFVFLMVSVITDISVPDIVKHGTKMRGGTALPDLLFVSSVCLIVSGLMVLWIFIRMLTDLNNWKSISPSGTFYAALFVVVSAFAMFFTLNWSSGFKRPPLLHFMMLQSLAAPFKPLVSHFIYYGPVIVLAIFSCLAWAFGRKSSIPKPLLVALTGFLPFLVFGSESRQWIGVFPIAVAVFAFANYSRQQRICCLIFSLIILLPAFWLQGLTILAVQSSVNLQSPQWEFYFGRFGPWMSVGTYMIGVLGFIAFMVTIKMLEVKNVSNS